MRDWWRVETQSENSVYMCARTIHAFNKITVCSSLNLLTPMVTTVLATAAAFDRPRALSTPSVDRSSPKIISLTVPTILQSLA